MPELAGPLDAHEASADNQNLCLPLLQLQQLMVLLQDAPPTALDVALV
eukprot:CAMPEP_0115050976 /NCGR_PEP_ID=MMETSP0227-20121206/2087_1 /TAXON_ID=89957 /ORGANISM="Polarella glacialis, Strain CCMP 1383" /LENGTH=47 /DNA_ID= /DNA_START= /DNA_END= /DNA_ORIENTATION=